MQDQDALNASRIDCGTPSNGISTTPLLAVAKDTPIATFTPTYVKANGCPVRSKISQLSCKNCWLGGNTEVRHPRCRAQHCLRQDQKIMAHPYIQTFLNPHTFKTNTLVNVGTFPMEGVQCHTWAERVCVQMQCKSTATDTSVVITGRQKGRVQWAVTSTDAEGQKVASICAVCVQNSILQFCPSPFNPTTPCLKGHY